MAWIILEGLDRSGKSSVAEYYKNKGYHYIHMDAPDKKYSQEGYAGPGYIDEMLELYTACDGRDVIFDRSIYGEKVWPAVFGRDAQLNYEDFEVLEDFEKQNETSYILDNFDAHWQRCVDNDEPLRRSQFNHAVAMYERLENYGFVKKSLPEYQALPDFNSVESAEQESEDRSSTSSEESTRTTKETKTTKAKRSTPSVKKSSAVAVQQLKLEEANAINSLLQSRIIKKKGQIYDDLENDIREFLGKKLENIFGSDDNNNFTDKEIQVLKLYAARILEKHKEL